MVFSSIIFVFFFLPVTLMAYYIIRPELRNLILLIASLIFYFWGEGGYIYIMIFYMVFNFYAGVGIETLRNRKLRILSIGLFVFALTINLGILIYFKYIKFLALNFNRFAEIFNISIHIPASDVHLPIGISFFSFQAISYVIDVYRGDVGAQKKLLDFSMYKAFFPQLIAGPIVRYKDISSQISSRSHGIDQLASGAKRFVVGLAKKVLIANNVALFADQMFNTKPENLGGLYAWIGVFCYTIQIYFDFSGYSDMAIGLAKMFGFRFLENFNYPYISRSVKEFWRRWHISLSSWFRDYLYISLGGNRGKSQIRVYCNLIIVFFLCGLWHGASWTFVAWGVWHGFFLVLERTAFGKFICSLPKLVGIIYTMLIVMLGWVFFRSDSICQAFMILHEMAFLGPNKLNPLPEMDFAVRYALIIGTIGAVPFWGKVVNVLRVSSIPIISYSTAIIEFIWMVFLFITSVAFIANATYNPFIYFRF